MRNLRWKSMVFVGIGAIALAIACGSDDDDSNGGGGGTAGSGASAGSKSTTAKGGALTDVGLSPLPLTMRVPKGGMGAMNMTIGDRKSVTVDIGDGSLNVQELPKGGSKHSKKSTRRTRSFIPSSAS